MNIYNIIKTQVGSAKCHLHIRSQGIEVLEKIKEKKRKI
jgi:hypothetical protein